MKNLSKDKQISLVLLAVLITAMTLFLFNQPSIAKAFGLRYIPDQTTATTTPYQTFAKASVGAFATTTVNTDGAEQLSLLVMLGSSTTPPTLNWRVQYSSDGIDWYDQDVLLAINSTTTPHVRDGSIDTWVYASTTANQTVVTGANNVKFITKKIVIQNLDTTYTRIVWLNGAGGDALLNVRTSLKNTLVLPK